MSKATKPVDPVKIFISYSPEDERLKKSLLRHLSPLERHGTIITWDSQRIEAGSRIEEIRLQNFNEADIVVCLLSSDFMASSYCYQVELPRALERKAVGDVEIIPILLRDVAWNQTPFHPLQKIPRDGKPVARYTSRDKAFNQIVQEIEKVVASIKLKRSQSTDKI
jgi:hypothetical protein